MLTGFKVSSLKFACVFYRTQLNTKGESHWIEFWIERVDEKNGVICLVIMFTSRVMAFEMSEMAIFFILSW